MKRSSISLLVAVLATAAHAASPIVPIQDPVDGVWYRGDQLHPRRLPPGDAPGYRIGDVRWGFSPPNADGLHAARFADTRFDPEEVTEVHWVDNPFHPKTSHNALLFVVGPGGLVNEVLGEDSHGLVLSVEGRVPAGEGYSLVKGLHGEYPVVYQLSTWEDYVQHVCGIYQGRLRPYRLALSPEEAVETARVAVEAALVNRRQERYHLLRNSCTTAAFDVLFEGIRGRFPGFWGRLHRIAYRRKHLGGLFVNPSMSMPHRVRKLLDRRELIESVLPEVGPRPY
jgi:hypothetical protein